MDKLTLHQLIYEATNTPKLEYNEDLFIFRENIRRTIKSVKKRLGLLQTLLGEIDYEITLRHLEYEEIE